MCWQTDKPLPIADFRAGKVVKFAHLNAEINFSDIDRRQRCVSKHCDKLVIFGCQIATFRLTISTSTLGAVLWAVLRSFHAAFRL
jgi:hypothetical protein